jgi:hypothetical protein
LTKKKFSTVRYVTDDGRGCPTTYTHPVAASENRICRICRSAYPEEKKKSVAGKFGAVKYRSETYGRTQKLNREDYGVDKYWYFFFF